MNTAKSLHKFAISKGYKVAVRCGEEGDVLQKSTTDWNQVKKAILSVCMTELVIRDTVNKETIAWALVIPHDNPEEWVSDWGICDFMREWEKTLKI